ncbi:MAG: hypothetical protein VW644_02975, partial [Alphaproteobacteria bacterium]
VARYARPVWFLPVGLVFAAAITFVLPRQMVGQSVSFLPETIVPAWYGLVAISAFGIGIGHMMMAAGLLAIIVASRDCSVTIEALPRLRRLARFYARLTLYLLLVYANYVAYLIVAYVGGVAFSGAVIITTLLVGAGILTFLLLPQLLIRNRLAEAKDRMLATLLDEFGLSDDNSVEGA